MTNTMAIIDQHNAEHYTWGEGCDGWHLVKQPSVSIILERMPPGTAERRHYHHSARQFFFVLHGSLTIERDGHCYELQEEQGLEIAPGAYHQVTNQSAHEAEFLVISEPPAHGDRLPAPQPR